VEKRWASKGELQPASKSAEIIFNRNESPATGSKSGIQKNRRLSLEESILVKHMNHIPLPTTRSPTPRSQEVFMFNQVQFWIKNFLALIPIHWII